MLLLLWDFICTARAPFYRASCCRFSCVHRTSGISNSEQSNLFRGFVACFLHNTHPFLSSRTSWCVSLGGVQGGGQNACMRVGPPFTHVNTVNSPRPKRNKVWSMSKRNGWRSCKRSCQSLFLQKLEIEATDSMPNSCKNVNEGRQKLYTTLSVWSWRVRKRSLSQVNPGGM